MNLRALNLGFVILCVVPNPVSAEEPSAKEWAHKRVQSGLVDPLAANDAKSSRFSRVMQAPAERRVRVTGAAPETDRKGRAFLRYEVDLRRGDAWTLSFTGCVYRKDGAIFVKRGDEYRPADFLLGKDVKPVADVCVVASGSNRA